MKLSILILTIPSRCDKLQSLLTDLQAQCEPFPDVEILYLGDNKKRSVGAKRNALINLAQGEYVVFIDDDDRVTSDYVQEIMNNLGADVIVFGAYRHHNGMKDRPVSYDLKHRQDRDKPGIYERLPNHLMVWRRALVLPFPELNYGEDSAWAESMKGRAQTQMVIKRKLYNYYFDSEGTETQKGMQ